MPEEDVRRRARDHLERFELAEASAVIATASGAVGDAERRLVDAAVAYARRDAGPLRALEMAAADLDPQPWAATCRLLHGLDLAEHRWQRGAAEAAATILVPTLLGLLPAAWAEHYVTDVVDDTVPGPTAGADVRERIEEASLADPDHLAALGLDPDTDAHGAEALLAAVGAPAVRTGRRASARGEVPTLGDGRPLPEARRAHMIWLALRHGLRGLREALDRHVLALDRAGVVTLLERCAGDARAAVERMFRDLGDVAPAYDVTGRRWLDAAMDSMRNPGSIGPDDLDQPGGTAAGIAHDTWRELDSSPPDDESVQRLVEAALTWARQVQTDVPPQLFALFAHLADRGLIGGATFGELVTALSTKHGQVGTQSIEDDTEAALSALPKDAVVPRGGPDSPLRRMVGQLAPHAVRASALADVRDHLLAELAP